MGCFDIRVGRQNSSNRVGDPLLRRARQPTFQPPRTGVAKPVAATERTIAPKRRRPARSARFSALAVSCVATSGLTYWFAHLDTSHAATQALSGLPAVIPVGSPSVSVSSTAVTTAAVVTPAPAGLTPSASVVSSTAGAAAPTASGPQGFDGAVVDTRYGPVQVQVQITNGAVSDVAIVQYPNSDRKSERINAIALPRLRSEALAAQSARVHSISGATYTSDGYVTSLQSAIDQARAAGATSLA
jgi:uncharacterized protein with FMN-binding domain